MKSFIDYINPKQPRRDAEPPRPAPPPTQEPLCLYWVGYDLVTEVDSKGNKVEGDSGPKIRAILEEWEKKKTAVHILRSDWLVVSRQKAASIYARLAKVLNHKDRLFVVHVDTNPALSLPDRADLATLDQVKELIGKVGH